MCADWEEIVRISYGSLAKEYRDFLERDRGYFPKKSYIFNAFSTLALKRTNYLLLGQDPYPRKESATGYAFIDGRVKSVFDPKRGFSKEVNKATSLRNFLKMTLVAGELISKDAKKEEIIQLPKDGLIESIFDLKNNFEANGILLLNRALIFTKKEQSGYHLKQWRPFMQKFLQLLPKRMKIIVFGKSDPALIEVARKRNLRIVSFEHPYNVSFYKNDEVINFFRPFHLEKKMV